MRYYHGLHTPLDHNQYAAAATVSGKRNRRPERRYKPILSSHLILAIGVIFVAFVLITTFQG
jgi:hypothetical protein